MAATSTNKQPLLVDHVMHRVVLTDSAAAGAIDIAGTNTAIVLVDGSQSDGCIIESIYAISRGTTPHTVNLFMSQSNDYLCLLYTSPSPRDSDSSRMPSSA